MENSIEEDIKILEENIKSVKENADIGFFESNEDYYFFKAVEHILSDYKRLQEEFKQVDHECSRLEQKEVEMEKIIDLIIKDLYKQAHISTRCYLQISIEECMKNKNCIECLKQYFENRAKELLNK